MDSGPGRTPVSSFGASGGPADGVGEGVPADGMAVAVPSDGVSMVALADGVAVERPTVGMAVDGPADGVAVEVGGVSGTRERRLRHGAFSVAGKSQTGSRTTGTMERGRGGNFVGESENKMSCKEGKRRGHTMTIYIGGVCAKSDTHARLPSRAKPSCCPHTMGHHSAPRFSPQLSLEPLDHRASLGVEVQLPEPRDHRESLGVRAGPWQTACAAPSRRWVFWGEGQHGACGVVGGDGRLCRSGTGIWSCKKRPTAAAMALRAACNGIQNKR